MVDNTRLGDLECKHAWTCPTDFFWSTNNASFTDFCLPLVSFAMDQLATPRAPTQSMPDSTPITDFALIESQKENIRPHAAGRSAATLSNLFVKSEADRVIQEGHAQHMKDVEEAERRDREGEEMVDGFVDLLDVYSR
jgi:hypothetical protein